MAAAAAEATSSQREEEQQQQAARQDSCSWPEEGQRQNRDNHSSAELPFSKLAVADPAASSYSSKSSSSSNGHCPPLQHLKATMDAPAAGAVSESAAAAAPAPAAPAVGFSSGVSQQLGDGLRSPVSFVNGNAAAAGPGAASQFEEGLSGLLLLIPLTLGVGKVGLDFSLYLVLCSGMIVVYV